MYKRSLFCGPLLVALSLASPSTEAQAFGKAGFADAPVAWMQDEPGSYLSVNSSAGSMPLGGTSRSTRYTRIPSTGSLSSISSSSSSVSSSSTGGGWRATIITTGSYPSYGLPAGLTAAQAASMAQQEAFLQSMQQQVAMSSRLALEAPAQYCAGEGEETDFCQVIKEYAAAVRSISDLECVPRREITKKEKKKKVALLGETTLQQDARPHSFVEVPTQEEVKQKEEAAAALFREQAEAARRRGEERLREAGQRGNVREIAEAAQAVYLVQAVLQSAYYMQAGTYVLITSAKVSLYNLKTTIQSSSDQLIISLSDVYTFLLSGLSGPLSIAWHLLDIVIEEIGDVLKKITRERADAERHAAEGMQRLSDIDALAEETAKRKATITATLEKTTQEIDAQVRQEVQTWVYGHLSPQLQQTIVDRVLAAINSTAAGSVQVSTAIIQGGGGAAAAAAPPPHPGYVMRFGVSEGAPAGAAAAPPTPPGAAAAAAAAAPEAAAAPPGAAAGLYPRVQVIYEGGAPAAAAARAAVFQGLEEAETAATKKETEGILDLGRRLARGRSGTTFHSATADYVLSSRGTEGDLCKVEINLLSATPDERQRGVYTADLGSRAAAAANRMMLHHTEAKTLEKPFAFFATPEDVERHVKNIWEVKKRVLMSELSAAPSFYTLTSTGCYSTSEDLKRIFYSNWRDRNLFKAIASDPALSERLRKRVQILASQGILPVMDTEIDKKVGSQIAQTLTSYLHHERPQAKGILPRKKGGEITFGFLEVCDSRCYKQPESKKGDVLQSFVFSADFPLMKAHANLKKQTMFGLLYFGLMPSSIQLPQTEMRMGLPPPGTRAMRDLFNAYFSLISSFSSSNKNKKEDKFTAAQTPQLLEGLSAVSNFVDMLLKEERVKDNANLLQHLWIQARGVQAAAEGFKPKQNRSKINNAAAIFSKLWFDATPAAEIEEQNLKPFPSPLLSAGLQLAFTLHTVVEEFKSNTLKQLGAAVKAFFVGLFKKTKRISLPSSWGALQQRTAKQQKINIKQYQGSLSVISQLADLFRGKFLKCIYTAEGPATLKAFFIFIQSFVALWMNPYHHPFNLESPSIQNAKKLFYYHLFLHPQGPSYVAARIIQEGCGDLGDSLQLGVVVDVKNASRTAEKNEQYYLRGDSISLKKESNLIYFLNRLMSTYEDPLTIVKVAMDFAKRCKASLSSPRGTAATAAEAAAAVDVGAAADLAATSDLAASPTSYSLESLMTAAAPSTVSAAPSTVSAAPSTVAAAEPAAAGEAAAAEDEHIYETIPPAAETAAPSLLHLSDASKMQFKKKTKVPIPVKTMQQILSSKLSIDFWCQAYKEETLQRMSAIKISRDSADMQRQLEEALDAITEVSIAGGMKRRRRKARKGEAEEVDPETIISFKCLFMQGNKHQKEMQTERAEMVRYALAKTSIFRRGALKVKAIKSWLKKKISAIVRANPLRVSASPFGLLHAAGEVWTGAAFVWPI